MILLYLLVCDCCIVIAFYELYYVGIIRASVDALCRDGTSEISRDPRTNVFQRSGGV